MVCSLVLEWEVGVECWVVLCSALSLYVSACGVVLESVAFLYGVCFIFYFKHNGLSLRMRNASHKCKRQVKKEQHSRIGIRW